MIASKFGVVVQGPVISTGRNFNQSISQPFLCRDYINNHYRLASQYGFEFVLCTWDTEATDEIGIPETLIHKFSFSKSIFKRTLLKDWKSTKYKQFYLTLKGIEILEKKGCKWIIKVRTDQLVDLQSIARYIEGNENLLNQKILSLFGDIRKLDQWVDFIFSGESTFLTRQIHKYLSSKELFPSVHKDFFYHFYINHKSKLSSIVSRLRLPYTDDTFSIMELDIIHKIWRDSFHLMPLHIFLGMEWRGSKVDLREEIQYFYGASEFDLFLRKILEHTPKRRGFPNNLLNWDALTIFISGAHSIRMTRLNNGIRRRLRESTILKSI